MFIDDCNIPDVHERQQVTEQLPNNEEHLPTESTSCVSRYGRPINPPRRYRVSKQLIPGGM